MKKRTIPLLWILLTAGGPVFLQAEDGAIAETLTRSTVSWDGAALPSYPEGTPEISILRIQIPPGVELPMHQHPVINAGVLLKGRLTVVSKEGKILHLEAGDPIVEVVETWHYGRNEGDTPAEIIVFYAGEAGSTITVKE